MRRDFRTKLLLILITVFLFAFCTCALAADKVVVIPLMGESATGNAAVSDVVKGKTFSNSTSTGLTGTLELLPTMQTYTTPTYGMIFNLIPAGTFTMGSPDGAGTEPEEPGRSSEETQHEVILTESFYMQTTEVTQKQWNDVVLAAESAGYLTVGELDEQPSGSHSGAYKEDYPVETVSWNHVNTWITALNQLTGQVYTLPTEAQWEYTSRATTKTAWPYLYSYDTSTVPGQEISYGGFNSNLAAMGWHDWNDTLTDGSTTAGYATGTKPVAKKQPNKWGLFDMQGNLYEWCSDRYGSTYPTGPVTDPIGPLTGLAQVRHKQLQMPVIRASDFFMVTTHLLHIIFLVAGLLSVPVICKFFYDQVQAYCKYACAAAQFYYSFSRCIQ